MMAIMAAAKATRAAWLLPPKSTIPKIVLATAVLMDVMSTSPTKLQMAAMMTADVGFIALVPTTVAMALGASVAPLTNVAPKQRAMMSMRIGLETIAAITVNREVSKV